jgi:hypothetical protein
MDETNNAEHRHISDRRQRPTKLFSKYMFVGRRRQNRRKADPKYGYYVDRYSLRSVLAMFMIILLCAADAVFTIYHLNRGATEINPLMNFALSLGTPYFIIFKYALTSVGVFFLLTHKNFFFARAATITVVVMYFMLLAYHLYPFVFVR